MKTKAILYIYIFSLLCCMAPSSSEAHLYLESPSAEDTLEVGTVIPIKYRVAIPHGIRWWTISYSVHGPGGPWIRIDSIAPGDSTFWALHTYNWEVPDEVSDSVRFLILQRNYNYFDHSEMTTGNFSIVKSIQTDVGDEKASALPENFELGQNYPNPFNPETSINFQLPKRATVELVIYNLIGQQIRTLIAAELSAGSHTVSWDGKNDQGKSLSSGMYLYRMRHDDGTLTRKMMLLK